MKKTLTIIGVLIAVALSWTGCKKDSNNNNNGNAADMVLTIQTGARTTEPDKPVSYTAVLVDKNGNVTTPTGVSWSVAANGGGSLGSFAGSGATATFTPSGVGYGTVTASVNVNGTTLTAKAPIGVFSASVFTVVPSAVIWSTNAGTIDLNPVYIGTGTTGYSYTSSDASVASVSSTGEITFNKAGECVITVTATGLTGSPSVQVPVMVVGNPSVPLPVVRVALNPASAEMFRGDNATFTAKAFNSAGAEVSSTFTWTSQDPSVATVDASGHVTAVSLGKTVINAVANGIAGQAEVEVLPDTAIILAPYYASIAPSASLAFTATTYKVNHTTKALTAIANPPLTWTIPTYGISLFDIATVSGSGVVTMRSNATVGMSTIVMAEAASPTVQPGVAMIMVSDCDCGSLTAGVTHISVTSGTNVNLSVLSNPTATITAQALDAANSPVTGATLHYCSSNMAVCTVDSDGTITATGPGTATVTVCNGGISTTITVNVSI